MPAPLRALIFGAGRIARGLIADTLSRVPSHITFVARSATKVRLESAASYTIRRFGRQHIEQVIDDFHLIDVDDQDAVQEAITRANVLFSAVGAAHLGSLGTTLSPAMSAALAARDQPVNLLLFENSADGHETIRETLSLDPTITPKLGIVPCLVDRMVTDLTPGSLDLLACEWDRSQYDRPRVVGILPDIPALMGHDHLALMRRVKVFVTNMPQAAASALGYVRGYEGVGRAIRDPELREIVEGAVAEVFSAMEVSPEFRNIDLADARAYSQQFRDYYAAPENTDTIHRILADPIRKLQPAERLLGPALLCVENTQSPEYLARCIAALLRYDHANDPGAVRIQKLLDTEGVEGTLSEITGIKRNSPIVALVSAHMPRE